MKPTLAEIKQHLRIDLSYTIDDQYINTLIETATIVIYNDLQRTIPTTDIPLPIKHAIMLLIGDLYENREDSSDNKLISIPNGIRRLISPYLNYNNTDEIGQP